MVDLKYGEFTIAELKTELPPCNVSNKAPNFESGPDHGQLLPV